MYRSRSLHGAGGDTGADAAGHSPGKKTLTGRIQRKASSSSSSSATSGTPVVQRSSLDNPFGVDLGDLHGAFTPGEMHGIGGAITPGDLHGMGGAITPGDLQGHDDGGQSVDPGLDLSSVADEPSEAVDAPRPPPQLDLAMQCFAEDEGLEGPSEGGGEDVASQMSVLREADAGGASQMEAGTTGDAVGMGGESYAVAEPLQPAQAAGDGGGEGASSGGGGGGGGLLGGLLDSVASAAQAIAEKLLSEAVTGAVTGAAAGGGVGAGVATGAGGADANSSAVGNAMITGAIGGAIGSSTAGATNTSASTGPASGPSSTGTPSTGQPQANVHPHTQAARQRFPGMYAAYSGKLTGVEQGQMSAFQQSWSLPDKCPFVNNAQMTPEEKAILAGAMLAASATKGQDCGDWVMRSYQYAQGDKYIGRRQWRRQKGRKPRFAESRWQTVAEAWGHAIKPSQLSLIKPGYWVMYKTGGGHSIMIVRVISSNTRTGNITVEAMESGWFGKKNIMPRYRTIKLNCGKVVTKDGKRVRKARFGSIFNIMKPYKTSRYERWLESRKPARVP